MPIGADRAEISWGSTWDSAVLLRLGLGFGLVSWAQPLSASPLLHALLGGFGFLAVVAVFILWWFTRELRKTIQGAVPFGGAMTAATSLLMILFPSMWWSVWAYLPTFDKAWLLSTKDPWIGVPWGLVLLLVSSAVTLGTVVLGARLSLSHFAPEPEPTGEVAFTIGRHGERVDAVPGPPRSQRQLHFILWLLGVATLLLSTQEDVVSLAFAAVGFVQGRVAHLFQKRLMAMQAEDPRKFRQLMSPAEYQAQGTSHTERALQALQGHLNQNANAFDRVREGSVIRLQRFSTGAPHVHVEEEYDDGPGGRRCACTVL